MIKRTKIIYCLLFFMALTACESDDSDNDSTADQLLLNRLLMARILMIFNPT